MDFQRSVFNSSSSYSGALATPPLYYIQSPPYADPITHKSWLYAPSSPDDAAFSMHHLRFPTPPITPPRGGVVIPTIESSSSSSSSSSSQKRRQSVIMKVGQSHSVQHVNSDAITTSECASSASNSSSPSSDCYCDWIDCGSFFDTLESLASHVTQVHAVASPSDGLYYCCWRGCMRSERGFNARYKMLVHVRTHTKEKPHQCHLCEKCFSRAENLKIHIRSHSGEKPYRCSYDGCHKAYSNSSDRFKHTRTHAQEKPYMCKVAGCQKRYTDPSSLRKHVKTFKHTLQLVDESASYPMLPTTTTTTTTTTLYQREQHSPVYICTPASPDSHFYLGVQPVSQFVHERPLDCYYTTAAANTTNYWSSITEAKSNMERKHSHNFDDVDDIRMELELPLDLRVQRN